MLGNSKATSQNTEPTALSSAPVGGVAGASAALKSGFEPTSSIGGGRAGVLTSNMGNIMAGAGLPPGKSATGQARVGGARLGLGVGGGTAAQKQKLGLAPSVTNNAGSGVPLQPRGNPTGGRVGLLSMGQGRGLPGLQPFGGQPTQKFTSGQKPMARPAQRFKIRKEPNGENVAEVIPPRRPFAGKAVAAAVPVIEAAGPPATTAPPPKAEVEAQAKKVEGKGEKVVVVKVEEAVKDKVEVEEVVKDKVEVEEAEEALKDKIEVEEAVKDKEGVDVPDEAVSDAQASESSPPRIIIAEHCEVIDDGLEELVKKADRIRIRDIDRFDDSPQLVPEYINEITAYLFAVEEKKFHLKKHYLEKSKLTGRMRSILLDWLVQVHLNFGFKQETMFIATSLLDRFLSSDTTIERTQLQLVGATCMYVACKFEEICVPRILDFANISDGAFTTPDVIEMEARILITLSFDLSLPIPSFFLRRCSKAASADINVHHVAKYIIELAMVDYSSCHFRPSILAASALALAMALSSRKPLSYLWTATVRYYSHYTLHDILPYIAILGTVLKNAYESDGKLQGVRKKYSNSKYYRVSTLHTVNPANWKTWLAEELKMAQAAE